MLDFYSIDYKFFFYYQMNRVLHKIFLFLKICAILLSLADVGISFYEIKEYWQVPTDYQVYSFTDYDGAGLYLIRSTFQKNKKDEFNCYKFKNINFGDKQAELINSKKVRIAVIFFRSLGLVLSVISIILEIFDRPFPLCCSNNINRFQNYIFAFLLNILTLPFYGLMVGMDYGDNCLHPSLVLSVVSPGWYFALTYILLVPMILVMVCYNTCKCPDQVLGIVGIGLLVYIIVCILTFISTFAISPLYALIIVAVLLGLQLIIAIWQGCCAQRCRSDQYEDKNQSRPDKEQKEQYPSKQSFKDQQQNSLQKT